MLPRRIFRESSEAFLLDDQALETAVKVAESNTYSALAPSWKLVVCHPFMHAENLEMQQKGIQLFQSLCEETRTLSVGKKYETFLQTAKELETVVAQFQRFPNRNSILSRTSTEEELAWQRDEDVKDTKKKRKESKKKKKEMGDKLNA